MIVRPAVEAEDEAVEAAAVEDVVVLEVAEAVEVPLVVEAEALEETASI